jgi:serine/threonine-protein kinase HipA
VSAGKDIWVYWDHLSPNGVPELLGRLTAQSIRGKEVFSFAFDEGWLKSHPGHFLDPDLQPYTGPQYSAKADFGLFMDASPDRWGRKLMLRREALRARKAGEKPRALQESDFLLGVYDLTRMGALRFRLTPDGEFQNNDLGMAAPPWARLRELEEASHHLDNDLPASEHERWLSMLLAPGSSLGGARPKACVTSPDGRLWMAKFPAKHDLHDTSAWEAVAMRMAHDIGIQVPETKLEVFSHHGSTFLARRFDRTSTGQRIHFASAMTLLGKSDGADADSGCSYLDLAELIVQISARPNEDLRDLWTRMAFSIAISNTDDHLRNHGFLWNGNGWSLSPAYDLNPNPEGNGLSLNITADDNTLDFNLALETAPFFRLSPQDANAVLAKIRDVTRQWRGYAKACGIPHADQDLMAPAFRS